MDNIRTFLELLGKSPKSRHTWRALACNCRGCGDLVIEVFKTPDDFARLVAVHHGLRPPPEGSHTPVWTGHPAALDGKGVRSNATTVTVLLTDSQDGIEVACRCGKQVVPVATLLGAVRRGGKSFVLDTPG